VSFCLLFAHSKSKKNLASGFPPPLSFRPRVRHGVTLLDAESGLWIPAPFVIPHLMRNLDSGFPRAPACAGHGRQAGMTGKHS